MTRRNRLLRITALLMVVLIFMFCFTGCKKKTVDINKGKIGEAADLSGRTIAVCQGAVYDKLILEIVPDANIEYYANYADMLTALGAGRVDAFIGDAPSIAFATRESEADFAILPEELFIQDIGEVFPLESELCDEFNEFLESYSELDELKAKWIEGENPELDVAISDVPNTAGRVIKFATESLNPPFAYMKDGKLAGYEVELAEKFCLAKGYGIEVSDVTFGSIMPGVTEGVYDMAGSSITITDERRESLQFSNPVYKSGASIVVRPQDFAQKAELMYKSIDDIHGKKVGVLTGAVTSEYLEKAMPDVERVEFTAIPDLAIALNSGKIDAYAGDYPLLYMLAAEFDNQSVIPGFLVEEKYGYILSKGNDELLALMNEFLEKSTEDGTLKEIESLWFDGTDEERGKAMDLSALTAENGTIKMAISSSIGAPMGFVLNGKNVGYDADVVYHFCQEYGYGLEITNYDFQGMLAAVAAGKVDIAGSCITITPERQETMLMTVPNYVGGTCFVSKTASVAASDSNFFDGIASSFEKTFIREGRWKLFLSGIESTMIITVLSIIFGTALGFLIYLGYKRENFLFNKIVDFFSWLLQGMPIVVFLMILFYIVFARASLSGTSVAIVGFSMTFAVSVLGMLNTSVASIDKGQTEAALALGYSQRAAFFKMVLPQAAQFFLPMLKSEIVSLIKGTAVVGYIAVQDLTKMGDIVRSRTYEAFFPLIVTAIIYFILAGILTAIVSRIEISVDPKRRDVSKLMKGVDEE
ncbi:MAG: transporter substrate-binding domain-containing protein [Oscillospiraceae bacterium]|nr:transporter substrate-binding domain-containing protein [Candidatus Limimonas egerieequi]